MAGHCWAYADALQLQRNHWCQFVACFEASKHVATSLRLGL